MSDQQVVDLAALEKQVVDYGAIVIANRVAKLMSRKLVLFKWLRVRMLLRKIRILGGEK